MRNFVLLFTLLMLCCLFPSTSNAQMSAKSFHTRKTPTQTHQAEIAASEGTPATEDNCQPFVDTPLAKLAGNTLNDWEKCIDAVGKNIPDAKVTGQTVDQQLTVLKTNYNLTTPDEVNVQLITTHYLSRLLRQWAKLATGKKVTPAVDPAAIKSGLANLDVIDRNVHAFMEYTGLLDPFAGSLIAGPVFGDTGKLSGTTSTASSAAFRAAATSVTGGTAAS